MTALTIDRKTDQLGPADGALPVLLKYPVEANTSIFAGAIVCLNAAGNAVPASAIGALKVVGRAQRQCINQTTGGTLSPDGIANGTAGSILVEVHQGCFYYNVNADSTITKANAYANLFASDDNTVSLLDAGGTRPYVGYVLDGGGTTSMNQQATALVGVMLGMANPFALNPEQPTQATQFVARAVVTSLATYTGSTTGTLTATANGAFGSQDGVAVAAGDIVFIQGGTTNLTAAADAGPWQISVIGGAGKYVLVRPDWFQAASVCPVGCVVNIGGEGTLFAGAQFKSFAAVGSAVISTNDLSFFVNRVIQTAVLVAGTVTITNVGIRSATKSRLVATVNTLNTATGTVGYGNLVAMTPGYIGTATCSVKAYIANMTINATDVSTVNVEITNW